MIFIHADDYGITEHSANAILECIDAGAVNSVSIRANTGDVKKYADLLKKRAARVSIHLDLTEGKCAAPKEKVLLLVDGDGYFKYGFCSLWAKYIFASRKIKEELKRQIALEFQAQAERVKKHINLSAVDSHCHMHMLPFVFDIALKLAQKENAVLRVPREHSLPFIKNISLWHTYKPVNIAKHILLNLLSGKCNAVFFGVMFSGKMDERVKKILPEMARVANRKNVDLEVLFHPCPAAADERADTKNKKFDNYYKSPDRVLEKETVLSVFSR